MLYNVYSKILSVSAATRVYFVQVKRDVWAMDSLPRGKHSACERMSTKRQLVGNKRWHWTIVLNQHPENILQLTLKIILKTIFEYVKLLIYSTAFDIIFYAK